MLKTLMCGPRGHSGQKLTLAVMMLFAVMGIAPPAWAWPPSERYFNPSCSQSQCDEAAAKSECESELALAKADSGLAASAPYLYCHQHPAPYFAPKFHIADNRLTGSDEDQFYLNDYQNTFIYKTNPERTDPGLGCCTTPPTVPMAFGDPISAGLGNKYENDRLYSGEGVFPLSLTLTYNSTRAIAYTPDTKKVFGRNRAFTYLRRVNAFTTTTGDVAYVARPDGKSYRFTLSAGNWVPDRLGLGSLVALMSGSTLTGWQYEEDTGAREVFDASGRLTELYDPRGYKQTLVYDGSDRLQSVTDPNGRTLQFSYNAASRVSQVDLPDGTNLQFFYTTGGDLDHVQLPDGNTTSFVYNEAAYIQGAGAPAGLLTGVIDESGQRYSTTTYDKSLYSNNAKATGTYMSGGVATESATYAFMANENYVSSATIALPLGGTRQITFAKVNDTVLPTAETRSCTSGCVAQNRSYTYDANGQLDILTVNGVTTDYDYSARGLETQRIQAANDTTGSKRTIQTDWHPTLRMPAERRTLDAAGALKAKTTWTYNSRGQMLTSTQTDPSVTPNTTRTTTYTYCEQADVTAGTCPLVGLLLSVNGPRTDVSDLTTYTYYQNDPPGCLPTSTNCIYRKGDLWKVTNAAGQVAETVKYDGAGRPLQVKDANGVVTDLEYHARGWLTARKVRGTDNAVETDDLITRIEYWPTGLVKKVTQPDGGFTSYAYDTAHRLTGISDNAGNSITYTLNVAGDRTKEETKDTAATLRRTLSRTYNMLGQLQSLTDAQNHNVGLTYDANGNLDQTTNALSRVADSNYDPLNRLSRTLGDMNGIAAETKFTYDALDNLVQVTDPKLLNTAYTYNGFSDLKQLVSPDTGTTTYTYDSAGNRASQTDARGKVANYTYDALNRLTGISYPTASTLNTTYTWDTTQAACLTGETFTAGRLAKMVDGSGNTVYCYDRFGHVVRKVQTTNGVAFTLRYTWNAAGQLTSTIYPDNAVVDYLYDTQGRVSEIGAKTSTGTRQILLNNITYTPFGPPAQWQYNSGRTLSRTLNQNYQPGIVQDTTAGGLSVGYEFDEVGSLKKLRDGNQSEPPQRIYSYDGLNRLTQTQDGSTSVVLQGYTYDKTGNRTSVTMSGTTTDYTYPAGSHQLSSVGAADPRLYDFNGNTTYISGTVNKIFVYGDHNRMTQYKEGSTVKMNYVYNGRGEQVRKYLSTTNTYTVYDEAGHWIGNYANAGATAPTQQAIWFGDLPVGLFTGAGASQKVFYVEPDALGTPRVVIDPTRGTSGTTVWKWDLAGEAFGTTAPNQDPDGDATQFVFDLRFPGQRYDSASGLNYNYFRDYDTATGRYVESDPIGLKGDVATYSYSAGRPLTLFDYNGLEPVFVGCAGQRGVVVCDGNGGFEARVCSSGCSAKCTQEHEDKHKSDYSSLSSSRCRGKPRGASPTVESDYQKPFLYYEFECRAHRVSLECAKKLRRNVCLSPECEQDLSSYEKTSNRIIRDYHCQAYGW